jgi:hypothetical protein
VSRKISLSAIAAFALFAQLLGGAVLAAECNADAVGKMSCQAGNTVQCAKHFDMNAKAMQYSWDYMNAAGQTFRVDTKLMNTTQGYTPKACTDEAAVTGTSGKKKTG